MTVKHEHGGCQKRQRELQELLKEKDEEVAGLMAEGTALSKGQHVKDTTIKQLRAELKDSAATVCQMHCYEGFSSLLCVGKFRFC